MRTPEPLLTFVRASFPAQPAPAQFFWTELEEPPCDDIPEELLKRIAGRQWTDVTIRDWAMVGTPPVVSRRYLQPSTFLYYLPSLVVGVIEDTEYIEFALEGMIPHNKTHAPGGAWWTSFSNTVSTEQRRTLLLYLRHVQDVLWNDIGEANLYYVWIAENIWSSEKV